MRKPALWNYLFILISLLFLISPSGCTKSHSNTPILPEEDFNAPVAHQPGDGHQIIGGGTFEIDLDEQVVREVPGRDATYHQYLNGYLRGHVTYELVEINLPYVTIETTIENPTSLQVYDVRYIYLDTFGKRLENPDGYTNYYDPPGGSDINPFTYFAKEYDKRAFPVGPGATDSETLYVYWPDTAEPFVDYVIECSIGGNAEEPIRISDIDVHGEITSIGGGIVVYCKVFDWQSDVSNVYLICNEIFTDPIPALYKEETGEYYMNYINDVDGEPGNGLPPGEYTFWMKAESPNPDDIDLWQPIAVKIPDTMDEAPIFEDIPFAVPDPASPGTASIFESTAYDYEGSDLEYIWEEITPLNYKGDFGTTGNQVENPEWMPPQIGIQKDYFFEVSVSDVAGGHTSCAVMKVTVNPASAPQIMVPPILIPNPIHENAIGQFSIHAIDPDDPFNPSPALSYFWYTISPNGPYGEWENGEESQGEKFPVWIAPEVYGDHHIDFRVNVVKEDVYPPLMAQADVEVIVNDTLPAEIVGGPIFVPNPIFENKMGQFSVHAIDPEDPYNPSPALSYFWTTIPPCGPGGEWEYGWASQTSKCPRWIAPYVDEETIYTFNVTVTKENHNPPIYTYAQVEVRVQDGGGE